MNVDLMHVELSYRTYALKCAFIFLANDMSMKDVLSDLHGCLDDEITD